MERGASGLRFQRHSCCKENQSKKRELRGSLRATEGPRGGACFLGPGSPRIWAPPHPRLMLGAVCLPHFTCEPGPAVYDHASAHLESLAHLVCNASPCV